MFIQTEKLIDIASWYNHGYVVIPNVLPDKVIEETKNSIFAFLGFNEFNRKEWYDLEKRKNKIDTRGMVEMYHNEHLWNNRQQPEIYKAFKRIIGLPNLHVSIDRVNFNPPLTKNWNYNGFIHWDVDIRKFQDRPLVQGLISLTNSIGNSGGFQCVPGFHKHVGDWLREHPGYNGERYPKISEIGKTVNVDLRKGDLLIFNSLLPHGNAPNHSRFCRMAQYITMWPSHLTSEDVLKKRVDSFDQFVRSNVADANEQLNKKVFQPKQYELSELGNKLLGRTRWETN